MKKRFLMMLAFGVVFLSNCKKEDEKEEELDSQTRQFNDDSNSLKSVSDQSNDDANQAINDVGAFGRGIQIPSILSSPLCGVTIDTTQVSQKILFLNFDGVTPCFSPSRTRSGQIKVELTSGNYWHEAGAVLTMTYINFKVVRLSDNKSIKVNGTKTLQNVNGHDWLAFLAGNSILKYRERAVNAQVVFDDGATAVWNCARLTEWKYTPADTRITFTAFGDSLVNGHGNTDSWGVNRYGYGFTTYYLSPYVSNTYCGLWRPNSGELVHNVNNKNFTLKLGCDQNGNPTPYACAYGFKITWIAVNGDPTTVILSY